MYKLLTVSERLKECKIMPGQRRNKRYRKVQGPDPSWSSGLKSADTYFCCFGEKGMYCITGIPKALTRHGKNFLVILKSCPQLH